MKYRKQYITIGPNTSRERTLIFGPILFIIYMNKKFKINNMGSIQAKIGKTIDTLKAEKDMKNIVKPFEC